MSRVLNAKVTGRFVPNSVYIGRPSKWGNPFVIGIDGTRDEVIDKYIDWIITQSDLIEEMKKELTGKHLICWCAPLPCHGDVILNLINQDVEDA